MAAGMDFSQIVQGTRQFFQGHPVGDGGSKVIKLFQQEETTNPQLPSIPAGKTWSGISNSKSSNIPPEIEARYTRMVSQPRENLIIEAAPTAKVNFLIL